MKNVRNWALIGLFLLILGMSGCTPDMANPKIISSSYIFSNNTNSCFYKAGHLEFYDKCGKFTVGDTIKIVKQ